MSRPELEPPVEDADSLDLGARTARQGAQDLRDRAQLALRGVEQSLSHWTGPRRDTFARGVAGMQVWLRGLADGAQDIGDLYEEYATLVRRTADEVADCKRRHHHELDAAEEARRRAERLDAMGDPSLTLTLTEGYEDEARAAERRAEYQVEVAAEAHRTLERRAHQIGAAISAVVSRSVPGGAQLSPAELTRRVHHRLGTDQPRSRLAPGGQLGELMDALVLAENIGRTVPAGAVHPDGSVDWAAIGSTAVVPARGTDPAEVAGWWHTLSADERATVLATEPALLGNLDGLPARTRDAANRACLEEYRLELNRLLHHASGDDAERLVDKLKALDKVEPVIAQEHRQLLLLDPFAGQQLHTAVAVGDVDKAQHIGVFVPGFTTSVQGDLVRYDQDLANLRKKAAYFSDLLGDRGAVATITWLGYDAPQSNQLRDLDDRSLANPRLAQIGGARLAQFLAGLDRMREANPHIIPLGHSYGSVVTGYGLRRRHTGVDAAALFGNPGTSVGDRSDLHVPKGHLFAAEAVDDWVPDLDGTAPFGHSVRDLDDVQFLETGAADTRLGHTHGVLGHTRYLENGSTSQANLAAVVAGLDQRYLVTSEPPPGFTGEVARESKDWTEDRLRDLGRSLNGLAHPYLPGT